ncbi:MAG: phenylalanine--tRNA ligase subunit alpha, partial [Dehalococcoidales bacterium]
MIQRLNELKQTALRELEAVSAVPNLESWRVRYLGRKSELTKILRGLAELPIEERKSAGALANRIKGELESLLDQKTEVLKAESTKQTLRV